MKNISMLHKGHGNAGTMKRSQTMYKGNMEAAAAELRASKRAGSQDGLDDSSYDPSSWLPSTSTPRRKHWWEDDFSLVHRMKDIERSHRTKIDSLNATHEEELAALAQRIELLKADNDSLRRDLNREREPTTRRSCALRRGVL